MQEGLFFCRVPFRVSLRVVRHDGKEKREKEKKRKRKKEKKKKRKKKQRETKKKIQVITS